MDAAVVGLVGAGVGAGLGFAGSYVGQRREDRRQLWQCRAEAFGRMVGAVFQVRSVVVTRTDPRTDRPTRTDFEDRIRSAYAEVLQGYARSVLLSGSEATTTAIAELREATALLVEGCLEHGVFETSNGRPSGNPDFVRLREVLVTSEAQMQRQLRLPVAPAH